MATMLVVFVVGVAVSAATYLAVVLRRPVRSVSTGGRHRARKGMRPMRSWDDTGPIHLAAVAEQWRREQQWRRAS